MDTRRQVDRDVRGVAVRGVGLGPGQSAPCQLRKPETIGVLDYISPNACFAGTNISEVV